jgi:hypothetical protein
VHPLRCGKCGRRFFRFGLSNGLGNDAESRRRRRKRQARLFSERDAGDLLRESERLIAGIREAERKAFGRDGQDGPKDAPLEAREDQEDVGDPVRR